MKTSTTSATIDGQTSSAACGALPGFFRGCIQRAKQGGITGYDHAAYELSRHAENIVAGYVDDEALEALDRLRTADDADGVVEWYRRYLPRCMALVPSSRVASFARGVQRALDDGIL